MTIKVLTSVVLVVMIGVVAVVVGLVVFAPQAQALFGKTFVIFGFGGEKMPEEAVTGGGEIAWLTYITAEDTPTDKVYKLLRWWNPGYARSERVIGGADRIEGYSTPFECSSADTACGAKSPYIYCCFSGTSCAEDFVCCPPDMLWSGEDNECQHVEMIYYTFRIDLAGTTVAPADVIDSIKSGYADAFVHFVPQAGTYVTSQTDWTTVGCGAEPSFPYNTRYCQNGETCLDTSTNVCCKGVASGSACCPADAPDYMDAKGCYKKQFDMIDGYASSLGSDCWIPSLSPEIGKGSILYNCGAVCSGVLKLRVGLLDNKYPLITFCG